MAENKPHPALLTPGEAQSELWQKIKKHLDARLLQLRAQNDTSLDLAKTQKLRGRIEEVKHLVALDKPALQTEADVAE